MISYGASPRLRVKNPIVEYALAMTNSLLLEPWPSQNFVNFPSNEMVDLSIGFVTVYQRVLEVINLQVLFQILCVGLATHSG